MPATFFRHKPCANECVRNYFHFWNYKKYLISLVIPVLYFAVQMNTFSIPQSELIHCLDPSLFFAMHHGHLVVVPPKNVHCIRIRIICACAAKEAGICPVLAPFCRKQHLSTGPVVSLRKDPLSPPAFLLRNICSLALAQMFPLASTPFEQVVLSSFFRRPFQQTLGSKQFESSVEKHPPWS